MQPKFCKDCAHCNKLQLPLTCTAGALPKLDLVLGRTVRENGPQCSDEREPGGKCGPGAKLFEPRPAPPPNMPNENVGFSWPWKFWK